MLYQYRIVLFSIVFMYCCNPAYWLQYH